MSRRENLMEKEIEISIADLGLDLGKLITVRDEADVTRDREVADFGD
jgi:hypothetical protein